jgi:hypothetical protein
MTLVYVEALILLLNTIATLIILLSQKEVEKPEKPKEPEPPKPPEPRSGTEASSRKQRFQKAVKSIVTHISMTSKKMQVGTQTVGQRITGTQVEEVPWPAKDINIRQSRGPEDLHRRLPSERGLPRGIQMARLLAGEALVTSYQEERQIKEPIIKPVYEHRQSTVYLLLDRSGSMKEAWKPALWKGVAHGLLDQAMDDKALFLMREFDITVTPTLRAHSSEEAAAIHTHIDSIIPEGGTVIKVAVEQAINDCIEHELTKNGALREAADLYQEVGQDYKTQELVRREVKNT